MNSDSLPYAEAAWAYRTAGWTGVLPIGFATPGKPAGPRQKSAPPKGYTGWAGVTPSGADVQTWIDGREGAFNIGIHLPLGVLTIDVDAHSDKPAEASMAALAAIAGPLPATWTNTARGQHSASRQHLFRATLPEGRVWKDHPGEGLDSLHIGHRYAVVWPSVHPTGTTYEWYDETGEPYEGVPEIGWLAELPESWILACSKEGKPLEGNAATTAATRGAIDTFRSGDPCRRVAATLAAELERIGNASAGAIHDPGKLYELTMLGYEGHRGVAKALSQHQAAYVSARVGQRGEGDESASAQWWRQVQGVVGKNTKQLARTCECDDPWDGIIPTSSLESDRYIGDSSPSLETPDLPAPAETYLDFLRGQLLDTTTLGLQPKSEPLVPGVFYVDKLAWIYGAPKSFKSFIALDLAASVATGRPWQGFEVGKSGPVLYLVAEGASGIENRVRAWEEHYGRKMTGVTFLPVAVQANSDEQWKAFVELAREIDPVLIIPDTQARITSGMEENSATEMGKFVRRLDALRMATGALVCTVHHSGRNGEHMRGSIAIDGAADTVLKVVRTEGTCTVECVYQKDAEEFEPFLTRVEHVGESLVLRRDATAAGSIGGRALPPFVKTWWTNHESDLVAPSLLIRTGVVTESTFHEKIKDLVRRGVVIKDETGRYATYRLAGPPPGLEAHSETPAVRHAGVSESGASDSGGVSRSVPGVSESACSICGEDLDEMWRAAGHTTHPTC